MKRFKRLGALLLAMVMVLGMSVTALADDGDGDGGSSSSITAVPTGISGTTTSVTIPKEIIFLNDEETPVKNPNITYTYTLFSDSGVNATVKDSSGNQAVVKAGVITANTNTDNKVTLTLSDSTTTTAKSDGTGKWTGNIVFNFVTTSFTAPGIYRYKITETTSGTKASVGIVQKDTYAADRYLDVYVQNASSGTGYEIYGYVLSEGSNTIDGTATNDAGVTKKSSGYVDTDSDSGSDHLADVDVYETVNLEVHKTTTGALADKTHEFPVDIKFVMPTTITSNIKASIQKDTAAATDFTISSGTTGSTTTGYKVKNDTVITVKGVPKGTTVTITETNDTDDAYKVKSASSSNATTADLLTETSVAKNGTATVLNQAVNAKQSVYITNTLDQVSPTGVVLRFAPYVLILAAGIVLLALTRRRKTVED